MCDKTPANLAALSDGGGQRVPAHGVSQLAAQKFSAATIVPRVGSAHGFRNIRLRPMVRPVSSKSKLAPDPHTPGGLGIVPVAPTVTFGGQTIYFETINTAQVRLKLDDGPSPRQPRIAVTNIESLEWEQVAWSRERWIAVYETSTGMARRRMDIPVRHLPHDGQECPSYTHPEILHPLEHTTVRVKVELAEPVPDGMVGTLHLAWYDPDNTLGNEPAMPPAYNGHGCRDNAQDVELVEAGAPLPGFSLPRTARHLRPCW